jgi:triosephosphate isomerase
MLIVANWKMNCLKAEAEALVNSLKSSNSGKNEVVICPPFTLLSNVFSLLKGSKISLGAQDCHYEEKGAFTGDISASQLMDIGARFVIVGHSERRNNHNEFDEMVKKKAVAAIKSGLTPIICIGEMHGDRKTGQAENVIVNQIENSVPKDHAGKFIIAYEPIWAIGTGVTPTSQEIEQAHKLISAKLPNTKILYGGSANDQNCAEICSISNVSGLLVGGASLDAVKFTKIMNV